MKKLLFVLLLMCGTASAEPQITHTTYDRSPEAKYCFPKVRDRVPMSLAIDHPELVDKLHVDCMVHYLRKKVHELEREVEELKVEDLWIDLAE